MSRPRLYYKGGSEGEESNSFIEEIINRVPLLQKKYKPPPVWGSNGHIQTALYSLLRSRAGLDCTDLTGSRYSVELNDETTITYDVFLPDKELTKTRSSVTLAVCPGLANCSENLYIKAFALQATRLGYKVAVLNHLGVTNDPLTSPRLFTLESSEEYGAMVRDVMEKHPTSKLIAVGFSLGGSLVCKYLGENKENQTHFIACLSLCQGYNFQRMVELLKGATKIKTFYAKQLTNKVKLNMAKNWDYIKHQVRQGEPMPSHSLAEKTTSTERTTPREKITPIDSNDASLNVSGDSKANDMSRKTNADYQKMMKCKLMPQLDEFVTLKLSGHATIDEYYTSASSCNYLHNIDLPTLFVNSKDDPLYARELLDYPFQRATSHEKSLFVLTTHGGHLGFFKKTGQSMIDPTTWLEEMILEYINAVVDTSQGVTTEHRLQGATALASASFRGQTTLRQMSRFSEDLNENNNNCKIRKSVSLHHQLYNYMPRSWSSSTVEEEISRRTSEWN